MLQVAPSVFIAREIHTNNAYVHQAITASFPKTWFWRIFGSAMVHLLLLSYFIVHAILRRETKGITIGRILNDDKVFDKTVPRVYMYSRADRMVGFEEADEHADIAKAKGWDVIKVQFENSPHCGHVREDKVKYWGGVMDAWNKGPRKS